MKEKNPMVDKALSQEMKWYEEFQTLRNYILEQGLDEELKWGQACYSLNNKNIVLIHGFKEYCAILFFKGALIIDIHNLLIRQSEKVQASRQLRFKNLSEIINLKSIIIEYVNQAIEVERLGLEVVFKETKEFVMADELIERLEGDANFKAAFERLTPGRQRAYILYFSDPKYPKNVMHVLINILNKFSMVKG